MLDSIAALIREFLVCDDHQLTVLTLWVVHTWLYDIFPTTPYLHIHSPEPECGKTTCLQLLKILSCQPWISSGPDPAALMQRLVAYEEEVLKTVARNQANPDHPEPPPANPKPLDVILLDDYHHTFSSSERQPLLPMLCGSTVDSRVLCRLSGRRTAELHFFSPKAFAGNGDLPRSLASRCIPIVLQRKRPSDQVLRISDGYADFAAAPLVRWLDEWYHEAWNSVEEQAGEAPPRIPDLTARQHDCAEPLLLLAGIAGGDWPEKAHIALWSLFMQAPAGDALQLLADIRFVFAVLDSPQYLSSKDLFTMLGSMENRPWAGWTTRQAKRLVPLLRPFKISSRSLRSHGAGDVFKGYRICDFKDAWERYLPALSPTVLRNIAESTFRPCGVGPLGDNQHPADNLLPDVTAVTGA